jgi:adenosylhomocysteine nucleosidase
MGPDTTEDERSGEQLWRKVAPAPAAADVGIVAALPMEVGDLVDRLVKVRKYHAAAFPVIEGEHRDKVVAIVIGGVGRPAARRAAEVLLAGHRPSWIIAAGFAGALNPGMDRNQLVLPAELIDPEGGRFPVEPLTTLAAVVRYARGRLLTVDRPILASQAKVELYRSSQADLVDMESAAVAAVCAERSVRFLAVRVISDDARSDLPPEIATLLTRSGSYRVGAALRAIWNRPSSLKEFWALHERAVEAADRLAKFLALCLDHLPR